MNKFAKATILAAVGILLGCPGARAQYTANDLVLGFDRMDNGGVGPQPMDYIINLGNFQSAVGVGGTTSVDLSSRFNLSTFTSLYGTLGSSVSMSVVGGNPISGGNRDVFATVLRSGLETPDTAGSAAPGTLTLSGMGAGANDVKSLANNLSLPAGGSMTVAQNDANSFNTWVISSSPPSFESDTGIDPRGTTAGTVLYEDLYRAQTGVNGGAFQYVGYFTLDPNGSTTLGFTPATVPEPGTCALLGGGLLLFLMRFRSTSRKG